MKITQLICLLGLCLGLNSCAKHFQVFHTQSEQLALDEESRMRFHGNEHLDVYYDFWSEGGVMLLYLVNKTDSVMLIDFEKSSVTVNYRETNYYADQNEGARRPYDDPNPSEAISTYYKELPRVLKMPPQSGQWVEGYPISFDWYPMRNKDKYLAFPMEKSPLKIENRLTYNFTDVASAQTVLKHNIWVSAIRQVKRQEFRTIAEQQEQEQNNLDYFFIRNPTAGNGQEAEGWAQLTISFLEVITLFL